MDALKLLVAFSPWIAFWIISAGHSMVRLQIGICVAAVLVLVMGITKLHRGLILWAGVVFFAFAVVTVAVLENLRVIQHLGVLASSTLFMATLLSIVIGQPFTESYAREHVPSELWESPKFIRSGYTVTGVWGIIFLANTLVNVAKPYYPELGEWSFRGVELGILVSGVAFTTVYSNLMRKNRASAGESCLQSRTKGGTNSMSQTAFAEFDELVSILRSEGHDQVAGRLHTLLHETAWTTGSELMGEVGLEILTFQRSTPSMSPELQKLIGRCMDVIKRVWPEIDTNAKPNK